MWSHSATAKTTSMSSLLSQDDEFLMDESSVLAFLDDYDMNVESSMVPTVSVPSPISTPPTSSDSASYSSSPKEPAQEKKKSWRQRRKEEVLTLREVVKHLEVQLERRKLAAGVHSTLPMSKKALGLRTAKSFKVVVKEHKTEAALVWERIAGRQSTLRQSSEDENVKLRTAVSQQLQQAKSLQRAIKRKLREDLASSAMKLLKRHQFDSRGVCPPMNNKAVFDGLLAGMDDMYADVDEFYGRGGMHELPCPGRKNNTVTSRANGIFVQFLDSYAVPFDVRQTEKVIWTPDERTSEDTNMLFVQNFTAGDNTRMKSMCFAFSIQEYNLRIVMRTVTRRYVERDRTVFIQRTLIEPIHDVASYSFVETNRMVLTRGKSSAVGPTTLLQTHREATLHGDLPLRAFEEFHPTLDTGIKTWESKITRFKHNVEDQLIRTMC